MIDYFIAVAIGYTLGAIPFGLLIGKLVKGVDVREFGSGKTGSTNVLRTVGVKAGIAVLMLDMAKGAASVLIARFLSEAPGTEVAAALATLVGHCWPVFIGFRGGRGTAPGLGALFIMAPFLGILAASLGVVTIILSRYVSLGSMIGTAAALVALMALSLIGIHPIEYMAYGILGGILILWRHTDNLVRIIRGQERKIGRGSEQKQPTV
ncbi:MAG: glycerol-3-phosphate 1-O-acyltransferase PlsY [Chloroflexi bacterium]|nr:glycerol-3-phosphate 1-O-acyltransferase PlsY [Chloroflexota bacterium]